jgi:hypothetical protein
MTLPKLFISTDENNDLTITIIEKDNRELATVKLEESQAIALRDTIIEFVTPKPHFRNRAKIMKCLTFLYQTLFGMVLFVLAFSDVDDSILIRLIAIAQVTILAQTWKV